MHNCELTLVFALETSTVFQLWHVLQFRLWPVKYLRNVKKLLYCIVIPAGESHSAVPVNKSVSIIFIIPKYFNELYHVTLNHITCAPTHPCTHKETYVNVLGS